MCVVYLSPMGWPGIYSKCSTSWTVTRIRSHWIGYFYYYWYRILVKDIERAVYSGYSSFLIGG